MPQHCMVLNCAICNVTQKQNLFRGFVSHFWACNILLSLFRLLKIHVIHHHIKGKSEAGSAALINLCMNIFGSKYCIKNVHKIVYCRSIILSICKVFTFLCYQVWRWNYHLQIFKGQFKTSASHFCLYFVKKLTGMLEK